MKVTSVIKESQFYFYRQLGILKTVNSN